MTTLQKLENSRQLKPTEFHPETLKNHELVRYLATSGTASNRNLDTNLFDSIHKMSESKRYIQAIGYRNLHPTILIFKK